MFFLSVGIAPVENLEYWRLFLMFFSLSNIRNLMILTDQEKGLCIEVLPFAFHSYFVYYIDKNVKVAFKIYAYY